MKIRRIIILFFIFALLFPGCKGNTAEMETQRETEVKKLSVVVSIFPAYDWVMNVLGEKAEDVELTLLADNGVDLHSYQPSVDDIIRISECDLFIYTGGASDTWVRDALHEAVNKDMSVISLMDALGDAVKEEELVEGMEDSDEHAHGSEGPESHGTTSGDEPEYDEHVWLSLRNAELLVLKICDALSALDDKNAALYEKNAAAYIEKLADLDRKYAETVQNAAKKTLLFGDRFPFRYLTDDYGLDYYAAFTGCSAETEASFETIVFLAEKLDELGLHAVLTLDGSDGRIAEAVIEAAKEKNVKILTLNSMQSISRQDIQNGTNYLSGAEKNLEVLKQALE